VEHALQEGFIYDEHRAMLLHSADPHTLLQSMADHRYPDGKNRWMVREGEGE
jgi:hypothetical protein